MLKLTGYDMSAPAAKINPGNVRAVEVYDTDGNDITLSLFDSEILDDEYSLTYEPLPYAIGEKVAEYINNNCYVPVTVKVKGVADLSVQSSDFILQPVSSRLVRETRDVVREDLAFSLSYNSPVTDNLNFLFDQIEQSLDRKHIVFTERWGGKWEVIGAGVEYNSPVRVNRYSAAEGFVDTQEWADSLTVITSAILFFVRYFKQEQV